MHVYAVSLHCKHWLCALEMIEFVAGLTKSIVNDYIIGITDQLRELTQKMNEAKDESTTDSEVSEDGTENLS